MTHTHFLASVAEFDQPMGWSVDIAIDQHSKDGKIHVHIKYRLAVKGTAQRTELATGNVNLYR